MTKPEFEWIAFNGGEAYVPKGAGPEHRVAQIDDGYAYVGDICIGKEMNKAQIEYAIAIIASALATPASDGLPEGWKGVFARRDGDDAAAWFCVTRKKWCIAPDVAGVSFLPGRRMNEVSATSLSEACLAADERFPVAKPEAVKPMWVPEGRFQWERYKDGAIVRMHHGGWYFWKTGEASHPEWFHTAEEAMAWADRERPVA